MGETSESIRTRVQAARNIQQKRFSNNGSSDIICNADMRRGGPTVLQVAGLSRACRRHEGQTQRLMRAAMTQLDLSARTIPDLAESDETQPADPAEALQYHQKIMMG